MSALRFCTLRSTTASKIFSCVDQELHNYAARVVKVIALVAPVSPVKVISLFQFFSRIFNITQAVLVMRVVSSALFVRSAMSIASVTDAGVECECERRMNHCKGGGCGAQFVVVFLCCTFSFMYLLLMRRIRGSIASVEDKFDTASVKYAALTFQ